MLTALALAGISYGLKAAGPLVLGGQRELPGWLERSAMLLPVPLLAALVATSTFLDDTRIVLDARAVGLATAAIALWARLPFVVVVVLAAAATATTRQLG